MDELTPEISDRQRWRSWLDRNHDTDAMVWLAIYKRFTGRQWATFPEALVEAICYRWTDSRPKWVDSEIQIIRSTRRKKRTARSLANLIMARSLIESMAMTCHGVALLPSDVDRDPVAKLIRHFENIIILYYLYCYQNLYVWLSPYTSCLGKYKNDSHNNRDTTFNIQFLWSDTP
ncbi:MAG: hypothetical protein LLG16_01590 [Euryarchaeota archaeon]|nr:hypothetical protein [Euryarchaeota archaeon]